MNIRIASWNIAGGHKVASLEHFDYLPKDIPYFAEQLINLAPDVVCLQESHTKINGTDSNASDLAKFLGMEIVVNSPNSPSHIDSEYLLGNAIVSKLKPKTVIEKYYPDPKEQLYWSNGKPADIHKKNLEYVAFEEFNVANNQMLPIKLFGFTYDDNDKGSDFAKEINRVMSETVKTPVIWCGDFNFFEPLKIYSFMNELNLKEALPDVTTRPSQDGQKKKSDHIYYSPEFELLKSGVIMTETDHYLCFAEFEFQTNPHHLMGKLSLCGTLFR